MYAIDYCYYAAPNEKETNLYFINATLFLSYYIRCRPQCTYCYPECFSIKVFVYERQDFTGTRFFITSFINTLIRFAKYHLQEP